MKSWFGVFVFGAWVLVSAGCATGGRGASMERERGRVSVLGVLDEGSVVAWRDHILPTADELSWEEIPWRTTLRDGVVDARESDRPLLLWVMNGHPLGCT